MQPGRSHRKVWAAAAVLLAGSLLAAACGGGDDDGGGSGGGDDTTSEEGLTPQPGGSVTYGLEAETTNGWCLTEGQLAISGIQVARTIYDTLTIPDENADYKPYLAESVESNDGYTEWTIKLRDGVTFHDGSKLDATVVKNNLDAYRGKYQGRSAPLFQFVFADVADVQVVDDMTVKVVTSVPWPSFPAFLYGSGRIGIMAQAQLDDQETCDSKLIGTGPFKLQEWKVNDHLTAVKNPDYWQKDPEGEQLPYLDEITYRPVIEGDARVTALLSGELNAMHTSGAEQVESLQDAKEGGQIGLVESADYPEVAYGMLNVSKPPFDNPIARQAVAYGIDRDAFNKVRNLDLFTMASGPFGPGEIGYLEDAGFPEYDMDKAKQLVEQYEKETGQPFRFTLASANDASTVASAQFLQEQGEKAGMEIDIKPIEQAALISTALGGDWQAMSWRNHPGGDPDLQYVWWQSESPVNFGRFKDADIDRLLDEGRQEPDRAKREQIYQEINKIFGEQVYNLWLNWTQWDVGTATDVHGVFGPDLPDGGGKPFPGLATGHPVVGMWVGQ